jgi:3-oxoacyl-[acyl-carrier protein] reductase
MRARRVALVTGGASGIGLAIANRLVRDGFATVIVDVADEAGVAEAARLRTLGGDVTFRRLDVTDEESVERTFEEVWAEKGSLDVLVNNAGVASRATLETLPTAEWRRVVDVNLHGAFYCLRAAGRLMLRQGSGVIVNVASVAWARGCPGRAAYAASKAALVSLTKSAAVEWADRGVRVNAVAPGYVATPLLESALETGALSRDEILARIPMRRFASARQIADVVAFLASPQADYITGHVLVADGGFLADYGVRTHKMRDDGFNELGSDH